MTTLVNRLCRILTVSAFLLISLTSYAQQSSGTITGTALDPKGNVLPNATISIRNEATGATRKVTTDSQGHFSLAGLPLARYTVEASATGFSTAVRHGLQLAADQTQDISLSLDLGNVSQQVTVQADETNSIAAQLAPMTAPLSATSARTEITSNFIQNFTSPVADYGEITQMVPGAFTLSSNGVGLGQSKTYFRGFSDGFYDIDFDGLPFYDTNSPTHHSWAFFPSQWVGGVDFDRSPGTASTIGPTPFGGSIHLLSQDLSASQSIRGGFSYGSFNTVLFDGQYNSGNILPNRKLNLLVDVHHMSSDGYQTYNFQTRNAGSLKAVYRFTDKTILTGFSGVIWLDANTPNFNATRAQIAQYGNNFLMTNNADPVNWLNFGYNSYHVPTDFEYVGLHTERPHGWMVDVKPYTYNYDNSEKYTNATPITYQTSINGSKTYNGVSIQPCNVAVTKKGVTALPCAVDKYNSYRKYGVTAAVSQATHFGVFRAGLWFDRAATNRHQYPTDPLNNWADQTLPNFAEQFWTNSYQPYAEYRYQVTNKLNITAGTKFAYYTINTKQYADNGKTIGNLCNTLVTPNVCVPYVRNNGSYSAWLPSIDANYRLRTNWSVYGQVGTGSIVPPSSVYDFNQTISKTNPTPGIGVPPKQQRSTTYQGGTVLNLRRVTFDADYFYIRFQNSYSTITDPVSGEQDNFLQPGTITKGFEAQSNIYFGRGLSAYLNGTVGRATYHGTMNAAPATATPVVVQAPSGLWVAQTPSDTQSMGVTYQSKAWDLAFFNKRIGSQWMDNGAYHNQLQVDPFNVTNLFLNYTIRNSSRFDQTKIGLSFNNLFDQHNVTSVGLTAPTVSPLVAGTKYTDPFLATTTTAPADTIGLLPGRSIMLSVTFGFNSKR